MAVCYSGDLAQLEGALAPVRELGDPVFDLLREQPYVEVQSYLDATEPKGDHYYWKTEYLAELGDDFLAAWRELAADCPIADAQLGLLHIGGALGDHPSDDGVVGNRDAEFVCGVLGAWSSGESAADGHRAWVRDAWQRVRPFSTGGSYINFQTADEGDDRIEACYGANLARLTEIKREHDPGNLFRSNRNVPPLAG
jgi:hypothetical protein